MEKGGRIKWIDGLRGIACLMIFVHHFILTFYPATFFGSSFTVHNAWEPKVGRIPFLWLIFGNNTWVGLFLVVSGVVLTKYVFSHDFSHIADSMLKRYFRLMLPVFVVSAVVYVMMNNHLFSNVDASFLTGSTWLTQYYVGKVDILELLMDSLINVWFVGDSTFSGAFWMLSTMFYGSFLVYILAIIAKHRKFLWGYLVLSVFFLLMNSLLLGMVLGGLLAYLFRGDKKGKCNILEQLFGVFLLIFGLYVGSYPSVVAPGRALKWVGQPLSFLAGFVEAIDVGQTIHMIAAAMIVAGIWMTPFVKKALEWKPVLFLGTISYSVYLVHIPLLFSFTTSIFIRIFAWLENYNMSVLAVFCATVPLLLGISGLFYWLVEKNSNRLINTLLSKF